MSIRKAKKYNPKAFFDDLKRVREVMVYVGKTNSYYQVKKKDVLQDAESREIVYYITRSIFVIERDVMVII